MTKPAALTDPIFHDEDAARAHFETLRWEGGVPVCFHCGVIGDAARVGRDEERAEARKTAGKKTARAGLYYCRACSKTFTATMGTIYEDSHIPLHKWMLATHLMNSCKRGVSAAELQRNLGLGSYRTAWFMAHRIREGMGVDKHGEPMGGAGKIVEADETYYGRSNSGEPTKPKGGMRPHKDRRPKRAVVALMERGGKARVFHVGNADKETVAAIIQKHVDPASRLHTDESRLYVGADAHTATHETVKHSAGEYARGDVHTNSAEGFFGQFKRGMSGVYGHCDEKYLARYLKEFEFRHNHRVKLGFGDKERAALAVKGTVGKRLTLRQPKGIQAPV
ncbi:MAG: IS1595 family transposase [Hyphomonadaceae bacterium]